MSTELQIGTQTSPACSKGLKPFKFDGADRSIRASQTQLLPAVCTQPLTLNYEDPDIMPSLTWSQTEESEVSPSLAFEGFSELPIPDDNFTDYKPHFAFRQPLTFEDRLTFEVNNFNKGMSVSSGGQPIRSFESGSSIPANFEFPMEDHGFNFDMLGLLLPPIEMPESNECPTFEVFDGNDSMYSKDFALGRPAKLEVYNFKFDMHGLSLPQSEMSANDGEDFALGLPLDPIFNDISAIEEAGLDSFFSSLDNSTNVSADNAAAVLPSAQTPAFSIDQQLEDFLKEISEAEPVTFLPDLNTLDHSDLKTDQAAMGSFSLRSIENLQHTNKFSFNDSSESRVISMSKDSGCNDAENKASTQDNTQDAFECFKVDSGETFETADTTSAHSSSPDAARPYGCIACSRSFKTEHALAVHIKAHSRNVRFKCTVKLCARKCQSAAELAQHSATHASRRIFVCGFANCPRRFATADNHNLHVRTHIGERPYRCDFAGCTQAFALTMNLRNHKRAHIHTSYKPFVCGHRGCEKKYSKRSAYYKHKERHLDEKPFVCEICSMGYAMGKLLKNHMQLVHNTRNGVVGL